MSKRKQRITKIIWKVDGRTEINDCRRMAEGAGRLRDTHPSVVNSSSKKFVFFRSQGLSRVFLPTSFVPGDTLV